VGPHGVQTWQVLDMLEQINTPGDYACSVDDLVATLAARARYGRENLDALPGPGIAPTES
jgi:hypothetical protein